MVPNVELPLVTPLTVQVTAVLEVPATDAVKPVFELTIRLCGLVGVVIETTTPPEIVTLTDADLDTSALLVAVMLNVAGLGTVVGALYVIDKPEPVMVPKVELPLVMPFTAQVTAALEVPVTEAVIPKVPFTGTVCELKGVVMDTATESAVEGPNRVIVG
jgi:hypothetical protein